MSVLRTVINIQRHLYFDIKDYISVKYARKLHIGTLTVQHEEKKTRPPTHEIPAAWRETISTQETVSEMRPIGTIFNFGARTPIIARIL